MSFGRITFVAWAALALAALPSIAAEASADQAVEQASFSTAHAGRQEARHRVTIWRGGTPTLASTSARMDDEIDGEAQPMPPNAPDTQNLWRDDASTDSGSPFLDEANAPAAESGGACDSCGQQGCTGCGGRSCGSAGGCGGGCMGLCTPWWAHRTSLFAQYLYLGPSGADVAYAQQQIGNTPFGRVGTVDQNFTSAYRAGFGVALGQCASVQAAYTNFHSHNVDSLSAPNLQGGNVRSLLLAPNTPNSSSTSSFLQAGNDIDFQTADVDYRHVLTASDRFVLNYSLGGRYGKLEQSFTQVGDFTSPSARVETATNITFEGGGARLGLDFMQRLGNTRFGVYGNGFLSVLFGKFNSQFGQFDLTNTTVQAATTWDDKRVVPVLEYELGINFTTFGGWRSSVGYYSAFWFNTVSTSQFVQAVQSANFVNLGETITFNGLVTRLEYRF